MNLKEHEHLKKVKEIKKRIPENNLSGLQSLQFYVIQMLIEALKFFFKSEVNICEKKNFDNRV